MSEPTVTALVRVYNGERHVAETIEAILAQTRPADEVLVVDDGSTDATPAVLAGFGPKIRVVRQPNGGLADAFERGFLEAHGDYVANCDADDLWQPDKLERQLAALRRHPEIDIAFGAAEVFGTRAGAFNTAYSGEGLLEPAGLRRELYTADRICVSSALIRRALKERVGPFRRAASPCEDYDFWLRSLAAGAVFFQDRATLVRYRVHDDQLSDNLLKMHEQEAEVHRHNAALTGDRRLVRRVEAQDLSNIGRALGDLDRAGPARAAFLASFRRRPSPRCLVWAAVLSTPGRARRPLSRGLVAGKRAIFTPPAQATQSSR
jgi:glycosyltransferase involved in cell wall biosynthesis